jgi:hypothetical protein
MLGPRPVSLNPRWLVRASPGVTVPSSNCRRAYSETNSEKICMHYLIILSDFAVQSSQFFSGYLSLSLSLSPISPNQQLGKLL